MRKYASGGSPRIHAGGRIASAHPMLPRTTQQSHSAVPRRESQIEPRLAHRHRPACLANTQGLDVRELPPPPVEGEVFSLDIRFIEPGTLEFLTGLRTDFTRPNRIRPFLSTPKKRNQPTRLKGAAGSAARAGEFSDGVCSSGIGFARNNLLQCLPVHRAQVLDFFLRALSAEIPVAAYICR